ncbi:thiamine biosynthesis lipoprotein [Alcanivorax sp. S71-1-4]|nr:thiamine biosynthesis lipoprotein [Alcanivorax sp. S71-1-4]
MAEAMRPLHTSNTGQGLRALFLLVLSLWLASCSPSAQVYSFGGPTMGTSWEVTLAELPSGVRVKQLRTDIEVLLTTINQQMSTYIDDSDISRFNQAGPETWHAVPPDFARVLEAALALSHASGGAFDPTVGPLVNLWGFGPTGRRDQAPPAAEREAARARVGWQRLQWDAAHQRLLQPGGVYLDFSAIAKGYAVDRVGEYLSGQGVDAWLVDIGGEVRTRGRKADGEPWRIAVERPLAGTREINTVVRPGDMAMATSGDYRNFFEDNGHSFSHTIDPRTAEPVNHRLASVTVLHPSCMQADGLATLLTVLGPEEGMAFAARHNLAVLLIVREEDGFRELMTDSFRRYTEDTD